MYVIVIRGYGDSVNQTIGPFAFEAQAEWYRDRHADKFPGEGEVIKLDAP